MKLSTPSILSSGTPSAMAKALWVLALSVVCSGCGMRTGMPGVEGVGGAYAPTGGNIGVGGSLPVAGGVRTGGFNVVTGGARTGGLRMTGGVWTGGFRVTGGTRTGGFVVTGGTRTGGLIPMGGTRTGGLIPMGGTRTGGMIVDCSPGATRCLGNDVIICDPSGAWSAPRACVDQACVNGVCSGSCAPGARKCVSSGNGVQTCNTSGGWDAAISCGTRICERGACVVNQCAGSAGQWSGCRGTGCAVCEEKLVNYPRYLQNHPNCIGNATCAGQFYTCNKACPAPTDADKALAQCAGTPGQWSGCQGTGCSVCAEELAGYPNYLINHPGCVLNDACAGGRSLCNAACPPPTDDDGGVAGDGGFCPNAVFPPDDLIDDLNDGDAFVPPMNGRSGAWRTSHDDSPTASMFPQPSAPFTATKTGDNCHIAALYLKGSGAVLWGSNAVCGIGSPYDASRFMGISFWAKSDLGDQVVRVSIATKDTIPDGGLCLPSVSTGEMACYDHFGARVTITPGWKWYTLHFDSMLQDGWGPKDVFDTRAIYQVLFQIPAAANYAFWIDDLAFLGKRLPVLQ